MADGYVSSGNVNRPAFCFKCGNAFPWTERGLNAARELADELEELTPDEKEKLKNSFNDLVRETPKSELATVRFKKLMKMVGADSVAGMKGIFKDIVTEAVKRSLFGP